MKVDHEQVWFLSGKKAIGYYNAGAGFPPFIPYPGAILEEGSGAAFATTQADNTLFYLSKNERGSLMAKRLSGINSSQRVSTHAVEFAWQQYAVSSDAVGWAYQENGHEFWVIYFPTANATWAYDISQDAWGQRGYWVKEAGIYIADRAMCHTLNFGKHLVGDWASGNIFDLSSNYYDDFGNIIRGNRRSPTIQKENKWLYYDEIEFVMETGLATAAPLLDGAGNPRPAQIMLRWSNDGGKSWSNTYYLSVGLPGQYELRVIKRMLGRGRKRLWDVSWTDPYPFVFTDAFVRASVEDAA
jgi:hypothetical protein